MTLTLSCTPAENPCRVSSHLVASLDPPAKAFLSSGCLLVQLEDGEVREDWKDWRGFLRCCVQVQEQGHGADRRHQEVCGVRGRSHHQKDCTEGDQDAEGQFVFPEKCLFFLTLRDYGCSLGLRYGSSFLPEVQSTFYKGDNDKRKSEDIKMCIFIKKYQSQVNFM